MRKVFSFTGAKKIVFGNGSFRALVSHIQELNAKNPLVVMDKNLAKAGFQEAVANLLIPEGMKYTLYDKVEPEPRIELADEGAALAVKKGVVSRDIPAAEIVALTVEHGAVPV